MSKRRASPRRPRTRKPHKPRLGQHILKDGSILKAILSVADLRTEDYTVEIGAGTGVLTTAAAPRVKHLTALEVDKRLSTFLHDRLKHIPNLTILNTDALTFDYQTLPAPFKVIGNLPYYIATPLLMRLIESRDSITDMTLMFQEEVARRLTASPGGKDYGSLTIKVQYYSDAKLELIVPPGAFRPPPRVASAVVKFTFLEAPRVHPKDRRLFFSLVGASFAHRRKTVKNSILAALRPSLEESIIEEALHGAGIPPRIRGEELGIEDFLKLSDCLAEMQE